MRKLLLAGVALAGVSAYLPTAAQAQSPVFPETTRAGKLDGAAPGSVSVSIGGTLFSALWFQNSSGNKDDGATVQQPGFMTYVRLYPNFDYASPSGIHFGWSAEIRSNTQGEGARPNTRNADTLYWHSAFGYVSSTRFGKLSFGTPNGAIEALSVGNGDDFNTGGWFGEYGMKTGNLIYVMGDAYDGWIPKQKIAYISPSFAGFTVGVSFMPNSTSMTNNGTYPSSYNAAAGIDPPGSGYSKNRIEVAARFANTFGPVALKADVGYATSGVLKGTAFGSTNYQDVSMLDVGLVLGFGGFSLEGHLDTGKFNYGFSDDGAPLGPLLTGAKSTTAFSVAPEFTAGPLTIGASYYGITSFDDSDIGGTLGRKGSAYGLAAGGNFSVGPGVGVFLDALYGETKAAAGDTVALGGNPRNKYTASGLGIGTYFSW